MCLISDGSGLNSVVCELTKTLYYNYGVDDIFGIRMGYRGFHDERYLPYLRLTPGSVSHLPNDDMRPFSVEGVLL